MPGNGLSLKAVQQTYARAPARALESNTHTAKGRLSLPYRRESTYIQHPRSATSSSSSSSASRRFGNTLINEKKRSNFYLKANSLTSVHSSTANTTATASATASASASASVDRVSSLYLAPPKKSKLKRKKTGRRLLCDFLILNNAGCRLFDDVTDPVELGPLEFDKLARAAGDSFKQALALLQDMNAHGKKVKSVADLVRCVKREAARRRMNQPAGR
jgi:hypothetical protein